MNIRQFFVGRAIGFVILLIVIGLVGAVISFNKNKVGANDPKDATYVIEGQKVKLENGTNYFGNELKTDLNGDGREDVVFLLTEESGGSGVFYYVVASLNTEEGYVGSDGYFLGDRIAPQTTEKSSNPNHKGVVVVNYADRVVGESFATRPSIGKSVYLKLDTNTMQWGIVEPNFEGESR